MKAGIRFNENTYISIELLENSIVLKINIDNVEKEYIVEKEEPSKKKRGK